MKLAIRVIFGGIVAGVGIFFWGFVAHMLTPLGTMGIQALPAEKELTAEIHKSVTEPGFYHFPAMMLDPNNTPEMSKSLSTAPSGVLIFEPAGRRFSLFEQLVHEFVFNVVSALIAATLLSTTRLNYLGRVAFVTAIGLCGWTAVCASQWNWYAFPTDLTFAALVDEIGGFFVAGCILGLIVKPKPIEITL